jgi:hypothetical protein
LTKQSGNPVVSIGSAGQWEDYQLWSSKVLFINDQYHLWYYGSDSTNMRIGYATSPDGTSWTKSSQNPIVNLGSPGAWDDYHVTGPTIVFEGDIFKMWYSGQDGSVYRIGSATKE